MVKRGIFASFSAYFKDENGATIVVVGLALPVLIGAMALATEVSYWQLHRRALQNAADAAAIAAATNNSSGYQGEAKAVAAQYGFNDGIGHITVSATNPASAAGCSSNCYQVTITDAVPLYLSQVVGYAGTAVSGSQQRTTLSASAVATAVISYPYCIVALASSGKQGIASNGAPFADLQGCNVMSNSGATCHGHNLGANVGDAHGTNNGCGVQQNSNTPAVSDPYSSLAANLPANNCSSYPQEPAKKQDPPLPVANQLSGSMYFGPTSAVLCGDQQLVGDTTINNTVVVIENGQLDTNGYTLRGSGLIIVFSGSNDFSYQHVPSGGGTLDISAPTSGTWSGVALYQDPALTTNVDVSAAGNSPTWNISGLVYLPHSSVTFSGAGQQIKPGRELL